MAPARDLRTDPPIGITQTHRPVYCQLACCKYKMTYALRASVCHQPGRFIHDGSLMELATSQHLACVKKEIVFSLEVLDSQWFHVSSDYLDPGCSKGSASKELERLQHILGPLRMSDPLLASQVLLLASSPYRKLLIAAASSIKRRDAYLALVHSQASQASLNSSRSCFGRTEEEGCRRKTRRL
jgi:hypothetical protein